MYDYESDEETEIAACQQQHYTDLYMIYNNYLKQMTTLMNSTIPYSGICRRRYEPLTVAHIQLQKSDWAISHGDPEVEHHHLFGDIYLSRMATKRERRYQKSWISNGDAFFFLSHDDIAESFREQIIGEIEEELVVSAAKRKMERRHSLILQRKLPFDLVGVIREFI